MADGNMTANRNQEIKARLLATFRVEAEEHLQAITANLLALEGELPPEQVRQVVEATFRETHTLKGAARSVSLMDVEAICQACESVLSQIVQGRLVLTRPLVDRVQEAIDGVARLLADSIDSTAVPDLIRGLEEAGAGGWGLGVRRQEREIGEIKPAAGVPSSDSSLLTPHSPVDTIRLSTARLDALLLQAEELLIPKLAAEERVREVRALVDALARLKTGVRGQGLGVRDQPPTPELRAVEAQAEQLCRRLALDQRTIGRAVDGLQDELRQMRLRSASTILDLFPRMVRDLARERGKEVEWEVYGADLEIDRKVLETMKEPLIHLVRNAVDHGIERPEVRGQAGKAGRGRVAVTIVSLEGGRVEIRTEDDGRGIDLAEVKAAAVRTRVLAADAAEALSDAEALDLIYRSGLSTSPIITDLSGHGLGLAIVKERVERLGGEIRVETQVGAGTTVRIIVPASIATFRGLLIGMGGQRFLLPTEAIEQAIRVGSDAVERVEGREAIRWNGCPLPVARLRDLLGLSRRQESVSSPQPPTPNPQNPLLCVIVRSGDERVGCFVDEILGEREVLVKEFGPPLVRVKNVAGAGLLGGGEVVLILRPADLLKSVRGSYRPPAPPPGREDARRQAVILVVDDSITTRTMEKNLLEAAGYQVRTAVDGMEAWTLLKGEEVDLVVSDLDMPRMDGFELTTRIRADRKLADLPVVLVTALDSRQDKERGVEVGANAYIIKSSFDESNLLEIIRRLI